MINIVDLIVGAFVLLYLLRNAGGASRMIKNLFVVALLLMLFGLVSRMVLDWSIARPVHQTLRESFLVKLSYGLIKMVYPTVESGAPKIDKFIKQKIISAPTPEAILPKIEIPEKTLPKLTLPELPKLK